MTDKKFITYAETYAELKETLGYLTPEQLAQPVVWSGDERGGRVRYVWIAEEDWIGDPSDHETWLPRSEAAKQHPKDREDCDDVCIPAGTVHLMVD